MFPASYLPSLLHARLYLPCKSFHLRQPWKRSRNTKKIVQNSMSCHVLLERHEWPIRGTLRGFLGSKVGQPGESSRTTHDTGSIHSSPGQPLYLATSIFLVTAAGFLGATTIRRSASDGTNRGMQHLYHHRRHCTRSTRFKGTYPAGSGLDSTAPCVGSRRSSSGSRL